VLVEPGPQDGSGGRGQTIAGAGARSYLYVPADRPDRLERAASRGADALILDLEDAVPPGGKHGARRLLAAWLARQAGQPGPGCELWVRINPGTAEADITAVAGPGLTGVVVPKATPDLLTGEDGRMIDLAVVRAAPRSAPAGRTPHTGRLGSGSTGRCACR